MRSILLAKYRFDVIEYGPTAVLLKATQQQVPCPQLAEQVYHQKIAGLAEVIAAERDIVLRTQPGELTTVLQKIQEISWSEKKRPQQQFRLPVYFQEGPDWPLVAAHTGLTKEDIIDQITAAPLQLAMHGFMPGFLYLSGLPGTLHCPRKSSPRLQVPAGAIGLGGPYLGCYGLSSPGGWQLIGQCPLLLFDRLKVPPVPLAIEDRLQVEAITTEKYQILKQSATTFSEYNAIDY